MPVGESFWNPYRMIPVLKGLPKGLKGLKARRLSTHEKDQDYECFTCELRTETPLYIKADSFSFRNNYTIPGTSLKGMLRSLSEMIALGCACFQDDKKQAANQLGCDPAQKLCAPCRLFGALKAEACYMGRVNICDAKLIKAPKPVTTGSLRWHRGTPKPTHGAFYNTPGKKRRKMYFHQPKCLEVRRQEKKVNSRQQEDISALNAGAIYQFEGHCYGLNDHERGLLIYCLMLEGEAEHSYEIGPDQIRGPMRHKLGLGKAAGLGSVRIEILKSRRCSSSRYTHLRPMEQPGGSAQFANELKRATKPFRNEMSGEMKRLRRMMIFDKNDPRNFHYPDHNWFNNHSQVRLKPF